MVCDARHGLERARLGDAYRVGPSTYGSLSPRKGLRATPKGGLRRRPKRRPRSDMVRPARRLAAHREAQDTCIIAADVALDHARRQAGEQGRYEASSGAPTNRVLRVREVGRRTY